MNIGRAIKVIMKRNDIPVFELAKKLRINRVTMSKKLGAESNPKIASLIKVADAIGCKVSDIILEAESFKINT